VNQHIDQQKRKCISDYGMIGNSRSAALISKSGSIDWCCLPRFDSDSSFCALLDPEIGGYFSISPKAESFDSHHIYVPHTNVLVTQFSMPTGVVELFDCFSVTDETTKLEGFWPDHEILRKLHCVRGSMKMRMVYCPTEKFGLHGKKLVYKKKWGIICRERHQLLALQTDIPEESIQIIHDRDERHRAVAEFEILAGQTFWFSLIFENDEPAVWPPLGAHAEGRMLKTIRYWKGWIKSSEYHGEHHRQVNRSALTLKMLNFAPSGAFVAAPTTSLPESIGGQRNWDYRFCWLRDASMIVRALIALGYLAEARGYVSWLLHSTRLTRKPWKPRLQVLYDVYGGTHTSESTAPWLSGFENSRPVRVGNAADGQTQLDIYGEVIESLSLLSPFTDSVPNEGRQFVLELGKAILDLWNEPDEGIWEPRSGKKHHTHSKVLAWVGLTRVDALAKKYGWRIKENYLGVAQQIRDQIENRGFNPEINSYTQSFDDTAVDASLLVMPMYGYCDPNSPRFRGTIAAIQKNLSSNGLIHRYKTGGSSISDGVPGGEGAFGICNFWMAEALFLAGREEEGKKWFDNLVDKMANPIGLWSEEIDSNTFEYLGNYPQGFSHVGLINAALACNALKEKKSGRKVA
jgi:GH15 family glucan-1,4-alpha-glucosidase